MYKNKEIRHHEALCVAVIHVFLGRRTALCFVRDDADFLIFHDFFRRVHVIFRLT